MNDFLAPADDHAVVLFRRLLVRQEEWAALNDPVLRYAVGGEIVADTSRLIRPPASVGLSMNASS